MKTFGTLILAAALALSLTACSASPKSVAPAQSPTAPADTLKSILETTAHPQNTQDVAETAVMNAKESAALAKKAGAAADQISEIDGCVAAIYGDICLAGVTFDEKYSGEMTQRIRDMVSDRIRSVAPSVKQVAVTADPEVAAQISALAEKIGETEKLSELADSFSDVLQKIQ